jgi:hypothetical protein
MMAGDCLDELQRAIKEYDAGLAITAACAAVEQNVPPNRIFKAMTVAIREVGDQRWRIMASRFDGCQRYHGQGDSDRGGSSNEDRQPA